jgi:hypothetical protein
VWLAFAGAFFVPAIARAALIPACEAHDQLTRMPVEWLPASVSPSDAARGDASEAPTDTCTAVGAASPAPAEDLGDVRVPGMCDARGASVVAPQRILAVDDARIEATPPCGSDQTASAASHGSRHPPSASAPPALADHAVIDSAGLVLPASCELAPPYLPIAGGGPLPGIVRGIDHPPR